ncbi:hypothetical protein BD289DRAFT_452906 [Coniella lustricola]|uniref:Uncharacterized protein n=1 Tax=Coniella lustricola TaxID=2025994 RepID=A0A2T3A9G9_9PEZI|nr:hypothetical protein BD289DRAFT_452906 [Coniella lustricola]
MPTSIASAQFPPAQGNTALLRDRMDRNTSFDNRAYWSACPPWPPTIYSYPTQLPFTVVPAWEHNPRYTFESPPPPLPTSRSCHRRPMEPQEIPSAATALGFNNQEAFFTVSSSTRGPRVQEAGNIESLAPRAMTPFSQQRIPTAVALQQLMRRLEDSIAFCESCVTEHEEQVSALTYLDTQCRNELWKRLLEFKFKKDVLCKYLFKDMVADMTRHVQNAVHAAQYDAHAQPDDTEMAETLEKIAHDVNLLHTRSERVVELHKRAPVSHSKCKAMVDEMKTMVEEMQRLKEQQDEIQAERSTV